MTLGAKIKKLRTDKELTQKDLADQVHVTFQTVSKWEKDENEPDVSTLRELSKLFECSMDYLLSEDEPIEEPKEEVKEEVPSEPVNKTIIIHQNALHVCKRCNRDIPENELAVDHVCIHIGGRGRKAEYRDDYYHKNCLEVVKQQRLHEQSVQQSNKASKAKKRSFGWGIAGGVVALGISLAVFLAAPGCKDVIHPGVAVALSILIGYGIFADLYCILSGSYIGDVFLAVSSWSIKLPGVIFSLSFEGIAWLIAVKILFAIIGFLFGVFVLFLAVGLSAFLAMVSFPFILIKNIRTNYSDAL